MFKRLRLNLIKMLLVRKKDVSTVLTSLGFAEEEYEKRYNNPEHAGYNSVLLKDSIKDLKRLQDDFALMLGIRNYNATMENMKSRYKKSTNL